MGRSRDDRLQVIAGGRSDAPVSSDALEFVVSTRAGDRLEPWTLPSSPTVARLLERAAAAGLEADLAVRLCVEHALVRIALCGAGVDPRGVDQAAAHRRFERRLDDRDAAYARRLTHAAGAPRPVTSPASTVGLPLRLSGQLADVPLVELLRDADPAQARTWELAALAEGRTMTEWALLAALSAGATRLRA
jgi:hypothetical protein